MPVFTKVTTALALVGCLAGVPALAQDDQSKGEAPLTGLSMGEDPNAAPGVGQTYPKETSGDWTLQCVKTEDGTNEPCQLYQLLKDENDNPVAEITIFKVDNGGQAVAGANVVAPLETLLPSGILLNVDGSPDKKYPFSVCTRVGCVAQVGFTQPEIDAMKNGKQANLTIRPYTAPDVTVKLPISLIGFTSGFDKTTALPGQ